MLDGDLILQGGGDPYMTLERWWSFVHMLRAKGLKAIRGDIVIDNTAFALPPEDPGAFDGRPNRTYNVLPDALMVNFQSIEFRVVPNADTHKVDIVATPAPSTSRSRTASTLPPGRAVRAPPGSISKSPRSSGIAWYSAAPCRRHARSAASRGCCSRRPTYAFGTFVELWQESGGEFSGKLRIEAGGEGCPTVHQTSTR